METRPHLSILKRTGLVLLVLGLIDISVMVYCIAKQISYSSSLNIFAVIAGIFLMRGSLKAASVVRWFAAFLLAGFPVLLLAWPFLQPMDLILTQIHLNPFLFFTSLGYAILLLALLYWLYRELGNPAIQKAHYAEGRKGGNMRIAAVAGAGLVILTAIFLSFLLGGKSAAKARSIAEQKLGPAYRYHVVSMNIQANNQGTSVTSVVTAWNEKEIRNLPVSWEE